jgi:hypothetical protein
VSKGQLLLLFCLNETVRSCAISYRVHAYCSDLKSQKFITQNTLSRVSLVEDTQQLSDIKMVLLVNLTFLLQGSCPDDFVS